MAVKKRQFRSGITLIELIITALAAVILLIGISTMLAAGHKNFKTMLGRTTSPVVRNAYEARIIFDKIVRKSVYDYINIANSEKIGVYYYSDPENMNLNAYPDRYAMFYKDGSTLRLQEGDISGWPPPALPVTSTNDRIIADNVTGLEFTVVGASIRMGMTLDNTQNPAIPDKLSTLKLDVTTTAIRHNKLPD